MQNIVEQALSKELGGWRLFEGVLYGLERNAPVLLKGDTPFPLIEKIMEILPTIENPPRRLGETAMFFIAAFAPYLNRNTGFLSFSLDAVKKGVMSNDRKHQRAAVKALLALCSVCAPIIARGEVAVSLQDVGVM